ncbi:MAG: nicotinamide mononucleotide transporter [Alistipes sp.]|nr:nicotinamide mononucleotide transporter [Alistipes sp.]
MQVIEIIGTIVGLIYLWLEYRASIYLWIASIVMPAIYLFVYYNAGLYADFGINIYYLVIALYGWAAWRYGFRLFSKKEPTANGELPIRRTPKQTWHKIVWIYIFLQLFIVFILKNFTDSTVAWADAFTTALSIIGMWLLARKYIEQWWVWLAVDIASSCLYIYKDLYFTAALYALYAITVIFGYRKWRKLMNEQNGLQ